MATVKISELSTLPAVLGNTLIPVVSNIAGSLSTVRANVDQIRSFILGTVTTADLVNLIANVNSLFSNAAIQSGNIAQLFANAAVQAGQLATLTSNAAAQSGQITTVQTNLTSANLAMKAYVDSKVSDILDGTDFSGNITVGNLTISNVGGVSAVYATNQDGSIKLVANGAGTIDVNFAAVSNVQDPINAQDAVTLAYLNTALSSSVTNLVLDDTEVNIIDDGVTAGYIEYKVDGTQVGQMNPTNVEFLVDTVVSANLVARNILPAANVTYSLGSASNQWKDLWLSGSTIYIGGTALTVSSGSLLINGNDYATNIALAVSDNIIQASNIGVLQSNVSVLEANAAAQHQTLLGLTTSVNNNSNNITTLQENVVTIVSDYANVTSNISFLQTTLTTTRADIVTANTAMKGYVDGQVTALYANAASQAEQITTANTAMKGYVDGQVTALYANAASQAAAISLASASVTTANTAMKGYVDAAVAGVPANAVAKSGDTMSGNLTISRLSAAGLRLDSTGGTSNGVEVSLNAEGDDFVIRELDDSKTEWFRIKDSNQINNHDANAYVYGSKVLTANNYETFVTPTINTSNIAMKGYVDYKVSQLTSNAATQSAQIASVSTSIGIANTAMKGYVDGQVSTLSANAASQQSEIGNLSVRITTANVAMKGYVDSKITDGVAKTGDIMTGNLTIQSSFPSIRLDSTVGISPGIELAFAVSTEDFIIFEPEDNNKEWFKITDQSYSNDSNAYVYGNKLASSHNFQSFLSSSLPSYGGTVRTSGITNANGNGVGNIGTSANRFNTVFAVSTSAQYADLAENYSSDALYEVGTVVVFGGSSDITVSQTSHDHRIAGVVSEKPAYLMNAELENGLAIALVGRIPCKVIGQIAKGDLLVQSTTPGVATKLDSTHWQPGCVIGKALANYDSDLPGVIEVSVGRT